MSDENQGRDDRGATATPLATGFGPCRVCLRTFREGKELRTLFTDDSYAGVAEFPQPGPLDIHTDSCDRYEGGEFSREARCFVTRVEWQSA